MNLINVSTSHKVHCILTKKEKSYRKNGLKNGVANQLIK